MALDFVVDVFVSSDGAKYYGTLRNGVPSGVGTCIWPNNCYYDGEWRNGVMHGFGTYVWQNGQRYDGEWKDGRREGIGIKTYMDGSMYDGFWRAGKKHGLGVFRPAIEENNSRRHSSSHGWQAAQAAAGQQPVGSGPGCLAQSGRVVDDSSPDLQALEQFHAAGKKLAAVGGDEAAGDSVKKPVAALLNRPAATLEPRHAPTAGREAQSSGLQPSQQQTPERQTVLDKQQDKLPSPFLVAAAAPVGKPAAHSPLDGNSFQPILASVVGAPGQVGGASPMPGALKHRDVLAAIAADSEMPSSSPTTTTGPRGTSGGADGTVAVQAGTTTAPRKLFVREYDLGRLLREYPLTAEEIKMIFGFLWPKNKVKRRMQKVLRRGPRMQKKLGEVVYKGHCSYTLMLELQLGIRYSVGRSLRPRSIEKQSLMAHLGVLRPWWSTSSILASTAGQINTSGARIVQVGCLGGLRHHHHHHDDHQASEQQQQERYREQVHQHVQQQLQAVLAGGTGGGSLVEADFKEELTVYFPSSGSSTTPAHPSSDYRWKDYCPRVFRRLRAASNIDEADYMLSLAGSQALRQLNSPGKSGSMFLLSEDERFLVKTMRKSEMAVLLDMLPKYTAHMEQYPHSLITRFFGLHKVTPLHGRSVRFVVMANIFITDLQIHRRYDIKGSTDGRTVGPLGRTKAADGDPNVIFKDLDVDMRIVLEQTSYEALMKQLKVDCDLLRNVGVMDYSLLLGVHYPSRNMVTRMSLEPVPSSSLDGMPMPTISPLPAGLNTVPGSAAMSAQGSYAESYFNSLGAATAGTGLHLRSTISDDDTQQPPQQLQRLLAQQHQLYVQQPDSSVATTSAGGTPVLRSARQSVEQIPQQPTARSSMQSSDDTQPVPSTPPYPFSAGGVGPVSGYTGTAGGAGVSAGGTSAAGSHQAHMLTSGISSMSAKNWELYSGAAEQQERLIKVMERMKDMGFSEQMMKDVAELARLKILGGKLKKRTQRKEPPSAVLLAMQQQRQEAEDMTEVLAHGAMQPGSPSGTQGHPTRQYTTPVLSHLASLKSAFTGLGVPFEEDEDVVDTPMALGVPDPKAPAAGLASGGLQGGLQLGINMPALAVPTDSASNLLMMSGSGVAGQEPAAIGGAPPRVPEDVVLCFGIIDILQDYSSRKVLERAVKGVTHDKYSISVAPPKLYAKRFLDFVTSKVFMSQTECSQLRQQQAAEGTSIAGALQPTASAVGMLQPSPWALPPVMTSLPKAATVGSHEPDSDDQFHDVMGAGEGFGLPLATEDSFPHPPGQLVPSTGLSGPGSTSLEVAEGAHASTVHGSAEPMGSDAGVVSAVDKSLLNLLADPGELELISPVAQAASGSSEADRLVSAEQVCVSVIEHVSVSGIAGASNGMLSAQHAALAPSVKLELDPATKQSALEQQQLTQGKVVACGANQQQQPGVSGVIIARG